MKIVTKFQLHDVLRDTVSGFEGKVMGISRYATGCTHYGLAPMRLDKDGKVMAWEWLDESRLAMVKRGTFKVGKATSGPDMNPACK